MDNFCINLGYFLLKTTAHTVHSLILPRNFRSTDQFAKIFVDVDFVAVVVKDGGKTQVEEIVIVM